MRQGENPIFDLFMIFVRFWWNVLKTAGFIFYIFREHPQKISGPKTAILPKTIGTTAEAIPQPIAQRRSPSQVPAFLFLAVGIFLIGAGLATLVPTSRQPGLESDTTLLYVGVIGGLWLAGWGVHELRRLGRLDAQIRASNWQAVQAAKPVLELSKAVVEAPKPILVYTLHVPRQIVWSAETALHFVKQLSMSFPELLLSVVATHEEITWQVVDVSNDIEPSILDQLIRTSYPEAEVEITSYQPLLIDTPFFRYIASYRQQNMFVAPLTYVGDFKGFDPLNALTQAMSGLQAGERVTYLLALAGSAQDATKQGERMITQSTIHPLQFLVRGGVEDAASKILSGYDRIDKYEYRDQRVLEDKLRENLYYAYLWMQVDAPERHRVAEITALVDAQIGHFTRMPYNALSWVERPLDIYTEKVETLEQDDKSDVLDLFQRIMAGEFTKEGQAPPFLILEAREIAALWHPPYQGFSAPRIGWASGISDVPEAVNRLDDGIMIGIGKYQGKGVPVLVSTADRVTHLNVVGKTGTGKSTLLHTLIHQDIARGAGVAVIDPHGKLVHDVLHSSIPSEREADVVVLDIANEDYPPPLNPLSSLQGYTNTLKIVGVIERLFAGTEGAARMSSYLRAALIPLQSETHATMRDMGRMFMDDVYREERLDATDDPETLDFWDYQYNSSSAAAQRQIAEPIINRIRPFYANPYLYPILCHPDILDFQELIRQKKIILISLALDEERVPEQERNLIGALLMSRLQMSGMKAKPAETFFIYVDEVQRFVTSSLSEMLSEARKYNLSLVTANQYLGQLTGKTLEAVMGNVGTSVIFRCSPEDAHDLAAYTKPNFDAQRLLELDRFQAVVKTQVNGQTQPAFNVLTMPPVELPTDASERARRIRQQSIVTYTPKSRANVLAWLKERYPRRRATSSPKDEKGDEGSFYE